MKGLIFACVFVVVAGAKLPAADGLEPLPIEGFADDVLPDILRTLRKISVGGEPFGFVDKTVRARAAEGRAPSNCRRSSAAKASRSRAT